MDGRPPTGPREITERQLEVARLIAAGRTNEQIAEALGISLAGAKYLVSELLGRLGFDRREQVAVWYREGRQRGGVPGRWPRFAAQPRMAWIGAAVGSLLLVLAAGGGVWAVGRARSGAAASTPGEPGTAYRRYTAQELTARGMIDMGQLFAAAGPVESSIRFDLVAVRFSGAASIVLANGVTGWVEYGCCSALSLHTNPPRRRISVNIYAAPSPGATGRVNPDPSHLAIDPVDPRVPTEVGLDAWQGDVGSGALGVAVDERGHLFVTRDVVRPPAGMTVAPDGALYASTVRPSVSCPCREPD